MSYEHCSIYRRICFDLSIRPPILGARVRLIIRGRIFQWSNSSKRVKSLDDINV
jgi:hypothetical protein